MKTSFASFSLAMFLAMSGSAADSWKPAVGPLTTRWAKDVSPEKVHPEYPRPQMVREKWQNLNGLWDYAIQPKTAGRPTSFAGQILVPFPVESALSGVMRQVGPEQRLWYRRSFRLDGSFAGKRALLHFGAVDWETAVWLNGKELGTHRGGYDPFSFDVTEALKPDGEQELVVSVWDPSDAAPQPRGKQVQKPGGIFYTPTTGIWQTVWLEPVPQTYINSLRIVPDLDAGQVRVLVESAGPGKAGRVNVAVTGLCNGDKTQKFETVRASGEAGREIVVKLDQPMPWSPDAPWLYDLSVSLADGDRVDSYFGMRKVSIEKDSKGVARIFLNGKPQFMIGFLDQGFWPDGLYTAPTDEALRYDLEVTKRIGMNMCRKHVKVEPARWYYWCDRLGLLVWQDMPSGDASVAPGKGEITRTSESRGIYERELRAMIDNLRNVPSIVIWVVFNEGWGQFDTIRITDWTKQYDTSRLVNCASGWNDYPAGDVIDMHNYPGPGSPAPSDVRAAVLGEYGGLGLPLEGHTWQAKSNWGYVKFADRDALAEAYVNLLTAMRPLQGDPGLSAAVYTQTTDVETEVNGLMSYDRQVLKIDEKRLAEAHAKLFLPPPAFATLVPTSERSAYEWRYTVESPGPNWFAVDFDDSAWKQGPAGFGTEGTPGTVVRTKWNSPDIWIRRTVELPAAAASLQDPQLVVHHDEDAEIYINGVPAAKTTGFTTRYVNLPIRGEARRTLRPGRAVIAVHCKQTGGGQYIDVGLVDVREQP